MAGPCGGITIGSAYDCDDPIQSGVNQRLILMNLEDIDSVAYDVTLESLITDITMATGMQGFVFQGVRQSLTAQSAFIPQTVSVGYDHQVDFLVFDISQLQKDNLEKMGLEKMVAVLENKNVAGNEDAFFEVFGLGAGLEMQTNVRINADVETQGAYALSLKTSDNEGKEGKMPQNWFATDYATTKVLVDALLMPAV